MIAMLFGTLIPLIDALPKPQMTDFDRCMIDCRTCLVHCSFAGLGQEDVQNCIENVGVCQKDCKSDPLPNKPCQW